MIGYIYIYISVRLPLTSPIKCFARKGPTGGFWVELDVSSGDSGAGEKPGYVMIDASGFGTPGPCLQKAYVEDIGMGSVGVGELDFFFELMWFSEKIQGGLKMRL